MAHCFTYGKYARELNAARDGEALALLLDEVRRFAPSPPADPVFGEIRRWEEAVCLAPPGMLRDISRLKRAMREEIRGLYLAGEYTFMPSVEGALRSGLDAAEAAMLA
jgi:protoporphyrinogen oxidase